MTSRSGSSGLIRWFAVSFVLGATLTLVVALVVFVGTGIAGRGRVSIVDAEVGDCFVFPELDGGISIEVIEPIDCDEPHDAEVVDRGELNPDDGGAAREYPADSELFALTEAACGDPQRYVHLGLGILPISPNEATWRGRQGTYVCVAVTEIGRMVEGQQIDSETGQATQSAFALITSAPARAIGSVG